jgi:hypothetical protein
MKGVVMRKISALHVWSVIGVLAILGLVGITIPWNALDITITVLALGATILCMVSKPPQIIEAVESALGFGMYNMLPLEHAKLVNKLIVSEKPGNAFYLLLLMISIFIIVEPEIRKRKGKEERLENETIVASPPFDQFKSVIAPHMGQAKLAVAQIRVDGELGEKAAQALADIFSQIRKSGLVADMVHIACCPTEDISPFLNVDAGELREAITHPDNIEWENDEEAEQIGLVEAIALALSFERQLKVSIE